MAPMAKIIAVAIILLRVVAASGEASAAPAPAPALPPLIARLHLALPAAIGVGGGGVGVKDDGGAVGWMMECWSAVTQLRSCTNEIVLFFLNGESYLGKECCVAIRTVTRHCWPAMLAAIGFTAEEADVLRGFCDAEVGGAAHGPPPATPVAPAPAPGTA